MKTLMLVAGMAVWFGVGAVAWGQEAALPGVADEGAGVGVSMQHEINASVDRALDWLALQQKENGAWSNDQFPALTAMAAWAFIRSEHPQRAKCVPPALAFLKSCVQPDGGIYRPVAGRQGGGLSNYNTAICMTTLHASKDPAFTRIVLDARAFVAKSQHTGDDAYHGGFGYDRSTDRMYADLMNTVYAAEAMRFTESAEDLRPAGEDRPKVDWQATAAFITRMQNTPEAGGAEQGGFFYKPDESKAGTTTNTAGKVVFRSYGSMTYSGLLGLVYAGVDRDDPRVRSAFDWASRHWSLDENPGMGMEGYFFFFNVLSRSLTAYGADHIPREGLPAVNWRKDVADKLISSQTTEPNGQGYWRNDAGRYWEGDPVLVTAYAVLALQHLSGTQP